MPLYVSHQDCAAALGVAKGVFFHAIRVMGHPDIPTVKIRGETSYPVNGREVESMVRYLRARTSITAEQEAALRAMGRAPITVKKAAR